MIKLFLDKSLEEITSYIHRENLQEDIFIMQSATWDDMPLIHAAADLYVQASIKEGLGIAILEAMASNTPIIATCTDGIKETIQDGINGLLINPGDVDQLSESILQLVDNKSLSQTLAENGLEIIKNQFNLETVVTQLEKTYSDLLYTCNVTN